MSGESRYADGSRRPAVRHAVRVAVAVASLAMVLALGVARTGPDLAAAPADLAEVAGVVVVRDHVEPAPDIPVRVDTPLEPDSVPVPASPQVTTEVAGVVVEAGASSDEEIVSIIAAPSFDGWADLQVPDEQSLIGPAAQPEPEPAPEPTPESSPAADSGPVVDDTRAQQALAMISYPWADRLPGWTVTFEPARDGLRGLTFSGESRIEIYVRPGDSAWDLARVLAHELGHAVDLTLNDAGARHRWADARGIDDDTPWWPGSGLADFATGAGDFAECFATWQMGSASLSQAAGPCSADDLELLASMV